MSQILYNSNVPREYEPPLFRKACSDDVVWFTNKPEWVITEKVITPYHQISMSVQSVQKCLNGVEKGVKDGYPSSIPSVQLGEDVGDSVERNDDYITEVEAHKALARSHGKHTKVIDTRNIGNVNMNVSMRSFLRNEDNTKTKNQLKHLGRSKLKCIDKPPVSLSIRKLSNSSLQDKNCDNAPASENDRNSGKRRSQRLKSSNMEKTKTVEDLLFYETKTETQKASEVIKTIVHEIDKY